jgi:hypothetical protein
MGACTPALFEGIWAQHRTTSTAPRCKADGSTAWRRVAPANGTRWTRACPFSRSGATYTARGTAWRTPGERGHLRGKHQAEGAQQIELHRLEPVHTRTSSTARWCSWMLAARMPAGAPRPWRSGRIAAQHRGHANDSVCSTCQPSEASWAFSGRLRNVLGKFRWQLNYTRITAHGRYLMPREWGRDPFFTFLPRERNEGAGDVTRGFTEPDLESGQRLAHPGGRRLYRMPELTDARLNKYAMPSYTQFDVNAQYQFTGGWKGLAAQASGAGQASAGYRPHRTAVHQQGGHAARGPDHQLRVLSAVAL